MERIVRATAVEYSTWSLIETKSCNF